jgi:antitoxin (DNA-binding transcriptional repressor) of toxin-antitoxin stability system
VNGRIISVPRRPFLLYSQIKQPDFEWKARTVTIVTSSEVSSHLPQFLARVASGEEFLIVDAGKELARIIAPEHSGTGAPPLPEEVGDEDHPWRGVFALPRERRPLGQFSFPDAAPPLTHREPSPNFNFSRAEPDHA